MDVSIRKIVVPVDFDPPSERAARFACSLARKLDARVYLIHVLDSRPVAAGAPRLSAVGSDEARALRDAHAAMSLLAYRVAAGIETTTEIRSGEIAERVHLRGPDSA